MREKEDPSFYAIVPATVRYDETLTMGARLLYGEITALCHKEGYCWATNSYFGGLYKKSKTTISKWISQLELSGHITCDIVYREGSKEIEGRYIRIIGEGTQENLNRVPKKTVIPSTRKLNYPTQENLKDNTTSNNTPNTTSTTTSNIVCAEINSADISSNGNLSIKDLPEKKVFSPGAIFSDRLIAYLNEPGTPDFFWECFDVLIEWAKKKDIYVDWETKHGFEKNQTASARIFSRIRIATKKDGSGEGMELEIKKFLKKIDQWWYDNGISLETLDKNFEKIFNSKNNGNTKRDSKPEPGDYGNISDEEALGIGVHF